MSTHPIFENLRRHLGSYRGEFLPEQVIYLDRYGNLVAKPLLEASLDEIAFAIETLKAENVAIACRRDALEALYAQARKHGALGATPISQIAEEVTK